MKLIVAAFLFAFIFSLPQTGYSQKEVEIGGMKYVLHTVSKKETIFSICQKYKVSQKDLQAANPNLTTLLEAGSTVKIPIGKVVTEPVKSQVSTAKVPEEEFYYHKTAKKQTIFSIAKQYGVTANDLIRFNPELSNGLQVGQVLKIPVAITRTEPESSPKTEAIQQPDVSEYSVHPVVSGETIFSLERRYGVTHEQMMKYNPELQNGLKTGMKLKIPVNKTEQEPKTASYSKYQVGKGETLFSLSSRFGIEASELKKANPDLYSRSLEAGEVILIPKPTGKNIENNPNQSVSGPDFNISIESSDCIPLKNNFRKYKAALLLPFYLPADSALSLPGTGNSVLTSKLKFNASAQNMASDTLMTINGINIDPKANAFLEFYEGALIALDSLQRMGMNLELFVFDASNLRRINNLLQLDEFRELDLIIGPVYPELQATVASFAAKNRIPMVSPLSSAGNFEENNSWYFKVNSTKEFQVEQTASYIAKEFAGKKLFFLQQNGVSNSPEAKVAELSRQKLSAGSGRQPYRDYNFQQQGIQEIKSLLSENDENIFVIPTDNEAQVSVAVTNLTALAEHYNIVLMGTSTFTKLKSIQTENYHQIRLRYLSPYFIDYNKPLVRRFIGRYRETFSGEPSQFSYQGFDVSFYFMSALFRYGKDFRNCLPEFQMQLTQMDFDFRKLKPMGGFMNQGLFVTAYERNFDILNYGVMDSGK
ncbi:MAG: LysM peptidoglycan-binding domain-containing protein [Prolixibacteraceae bacterium]